MAGFVFRNAILKFGIGGKLATSEDEKNVRDSLNVILSTAKGERPGMPDFGCSCIDRVFDPNDPMMSIIIKEDIISAVNRWEPRAEINDIIFTINEDGYTDEILVDYSVRRIGTPYMVDEIQ